MARILVVDDSAVMRKNLVGILTQAGHGVVGEATNGAQALMMYKTCLPDLVTMDITMPVINGIEAVKLIMREFPNAKIIMVSALNQKNMVFEALEFGAKHYLIKPITPESLNNVVQKVLGAPATNRQPAAEINNNPVNKVVELTIETSSPETDVVLSEIFLPGHKQYSLESAGPIDNFIYTKKITCPVCDKAIEIQVVRYTKLAVDKIDPDFRQHYVGFEPLWYSIQSCPHCKYASIVEEFDKIAERDKKVISQRLLSLKGVETKFPSERSINQVFTSYYLALYWLKETKAYTLLEGKLWLRLAWLYEDVRELELSKAAAEKALTMYKDVYHNSRRQTTVEQDQRLSMLLGELCMRNELRDEAQKYFRDTIVHKGGNAVMNDKARDRLQNIRE